MDLIYVPENDILSKFPLMERRVSQLKSEAASVSDKMAETQKALKEAEAAATEARTMTTEFKALRETVTTQLSELRDDTLALRYDYDLMLHNNTRIITWKVEGARQKITGRKITTQHFSL